MKIEDIKTSELHYNIKLIAICVMVVVSISAKAVITTPEYRFEPPKQTTFPTNVIEPYSLSSGGTNSHPKNPSVQAKHLPKNIEHRRQLLRSLHQ
jgi:hypothetical protein